MFYSYHICETARLTLRNSQNLKEFIIVLPLCKMRKGVVTDIEIGGFEHQTGDFEKKLQTHTK